MRAPMGVADALKSVPGFWVEASGGEASANIRARGIPQEGFSAIALQEDGAPVQHDGGLGYLNADQSFRLDETIERIEVVRGGPSSIFASYAPGGTVNFITRKGGETPEGIAKLQVSDYGLKRVDLCTAARSASGASAPAASGARMTASAIRASRPTRAISGASRPVAISSAAASSSTSSTWTTMSSCSPACP